MKYSVAQSAVNSNLTRWAIIALSALFAATMTIGLIGQAEAKPNQNKTTGGITALAGGVEFNLNVTAFGEHPRHGVFGQVAYSNSLGNSFEGEVNECYEQTGNEAVFVGDVTEAEGFAEDQQFRVAVQDNSDGDSGDPDRVRVQLGEDLECGDENAFPGERTEGNLTVH